MKMQQKKREFSLGSVPDWVVVKVAKKRIALEILQKQRALPESGEAFGNGRLTCSDAAFNYDQHFFLLVPVLADAILCARGNQFKLKSKNAGSGEKATPKSPFHTAPKLLIILSIPGSDISVGPGKTTTILWQDSKT